MAYRKEYKQRFARIALQRESRGGVSEYALKRFDVTTRGEEVSGKGVAEIVEAKPFNADGLRCRSAMHGKYWSQSNLTYVQKSVCFMK